MPDPDLLPRLREASHAMDLNMDWPLFEQAAKEIEWLRREYTALTDAMRDEMDENLRLRELGGALPDENITAMTERLIRERAALEAKCTKFRGLLDACHKICGELARPSGI